MDRLYSSHVADRDSVTVFYSNSGNITFKTGAGSYYYDQTKKNAVTQIRNNPGTIPSIQDTIEYTDFNMTSKVTEAPYEIQYTYGPDNQRIKSVLKNNSSTIKIKYYSIGYEKEIAGSAERQIHYISSPFGLAAVLIKQGETTTTYYAETDHPGSIIGLLNADGNYAEQFSYDAWGRRRDPSDWTYANVPAPTLLDRGYTGHEHMDMFGLINMNGRMYDPVLGRFAAVDPIIQSMENSQSFNGYSYCLNNPLKYTDPGGYSYKTMLERDYSWRETPMQAFNNYPGGWEDFQRYGGDAFYTAVRTAYAMNTLLDSPNGGTWSNYSGTRYYQSDVEGFIAGCVYNVINDSWGSTVGGSLDATIQRYKNSSTATDVAVEISYHMAGLFGGVAFAIPTSDEGLFNRLAAVNYLLSNATSQYIKGINGWCSRYVFNALNFGNLCGQRPGYAYLAGSFLMRLGFIQINDLSGYSPSLCDIAVFDRNSSYTSGHIQMWCGSEWVSDFKQGYRGFYPCFVEGGPGFSPYSNNTPTFTIYRRPWWLPRQN